MCGLWLSAHWEAREGLVIIAYRAIYRLPYNLLADLGSRCYAGPSVKEEETTSKGFSDWPEVTQLRSDRARVCSGLIRPTCSGRTEKALGVRTGTAGHTHHTQDTRAE